MIGAVGGDDVAAQGVYDDGQLADAGEQLRVHARPAAFALQGAGLAAVHRVDEEPRTRMHARRTVLDHDLHLARPDAALAAPLLDVDGRGHGVLPGVLVVHEGRPFTPGPHRPMKIRFGLRRLSLDHCFHGSGTTRAAKERTWRKLSLYLV